MHRWAPFVVKHRRWIIIGWLLVAVAGGSVASLVSNRMTYDYSLPGEPGTTAANKLSHEFGNGGFTAPYLIAVTYPHGSLEASRRAAVARTFQAVATKVRSVRVVDAANTGDRSFETDDGRTSFALVFYPFDSSPAASKPTAALRTALDRAKPDGTSIGVTGQDALAQSDGSNGPGVAAEAMIGAAGALAVLVFVFASLLAVLPLVVATASIMATFLLLLPLTYAGHFSALIEFLVALVGLGVAIDYSLLFVTRWREERDKGRSNDDAIVVAMHTAGRSIIFSGVTVAIGLLSLIVLPVPFLRSVGVGGALIPLASVGAALSLTPAILAAIGPRVDRPRMRRGRACSKAWATWTRGIIRARWIAAGTAAVGLAALIAVFFGINIGQSSNTSLATRGPAYQALRELKDGNVSTGFLTPIEVLAPTNHASAVAADLGKLNGIQHALVPRSPSSNRDGDTVVVLVPDHETVDSKTVAVLSRVNQRAHHLPGVLGITGIGAAQLDFRHGVYGHFPLMLTIITLLTYVLLVRAFRSLLLPLKAVLLNLVSLAATYGILVLFWQHGIGSDAVFGISRTGAITFWIPLVVFAFLYGLSMDYEVFILARIREEYDTIHLTDRAVVHGMAKTGRLVTSAALILFLAFTALATGPGTDLKVMATGLGIGVLVDATVIRCVLVPALVSLFGSSNWYLPPKVARLLRVPRFRPGVGHDVRAGEMQGTLSA